MIAVSDAVILVVSASMLAAGIYRWQYNENQASQLAASSFNRSTINAPVNPGQSAYRADSVQTGTASVNSSGGLMGKPASQAPAAQVAGAVPPVPSAVVVASAERAIESGTEDAASQATPTSSSRQGSSVPLYGVHTVKWGDTLSVLAESWGTSVDTLQSLNGIDGWMINVGDELRYPLPVN